MPPETEATIETQEVTDNSNDVETQEPPANGDNSQVENNQEPENGSGAEGEEYQGKFNDLATANKSYTELEKKLGEQSNELGELRKKAELADKLQEQINAQNLQTAKEAGFETYEEFENHKEVGEFVADQYAQYLKECDYPDEMVKLLAEYRKNPSPETLELIEADFPTEVIKKVAASEEIFKGQLRQKQNEALEQQVFSSAKQYLDVNVAKYAEEFKNPAFAALYGEAFRAYGCDLDTDKFVSLMKQYGEAVVKAAGIKKSIALENDAVTDEIAGLTGGSTQPKVQEKNILEMSEEEMRKELQKYR